MKLPKIKRVVVYNPQLNFNIAEFENSADIYTRCTDYCKSIATFGTADLVNSIGLVIECDDRHVRISLTDFLLIINMSL